MTDGMINPTLTGSKAGSLTPDRRRSSGAGNVREQLATNQGSVFYSSPRSAASFIGLAMSAVSSTFSNQMQSPGIPPVAAIAPQTAAQAPMATKHRLKAILTVDSKTTEILIANDNVKRVFGLLHYTLIGKRLTEVFSASADEKLPAIPYNELFAQDGKLRAVYGKAVDIVDAAGNRGTVCVWSYPLTHAAAAASERIVSGKQQMLVRAPSAILSPTRRIGDTLNYRAGNITTPSHRQVVKTARQTRFVALTLRATAIVSGVALLSTVIYSNRLHIFGFIIDDSNYAKQYFRMITKIDQLQKAKAKRTALHSEGRQHSKPMIMSRRTQHA
ncbi:PAS domain-containing serine/threonine-protein kinase [Toxocara canis]|uniref:PAS domain-containing serine/threonine-protein kinase n=1 Tax=Toxocara canis TaxID=6265 RepID=A0A0B2VCX1_TOXCA|nr:PAS domain-containing serine/threonine-protein kinase [Toxocara canis]